MRALLRDHTQPNQVDNHLIGLGFFVWGAVADVFKNGQRARIIGRLDFPPRSAFFQLYAKAIKRHGHHGVLPNGEHEVHYFLFPQMLS